MHFRETLNNASPHRLLHRQCLPSLGHTQAAHWRPHSQVVPHQHHQAPMAQKHQIEALRQAEPDSFAVPIQIQPNTAHNLVLASLAAVVAAGLLGIAARIEHIAAVLELLGIDPMDIAPSSPLAAGLAVHTASSSQPAVAV